MTLEELKKEVGIRMNWNDSEVDMMFNSFFHVTQEEGWVWLGNDELGRDIMFHPYKGYVMFNPLN